MNPNDEYLDWRTEYEHEPVNQQEQEAEEAYMDQMISWHNDRG